MNTISIWSYIGCVVLSITLLFPTFIALIKGGRAFLPFFVYGVSVWLFLVVGVISYNYKIGIYHSFSFSYFAILLFAIFPVFIGAFIAFFSRVGSYNVWPDIFSNRRRSFFVLGAVATIIFLGVVSYSFKVGLPPLWKLLSSGGGLVGLSGNEIYELRKGATYTEAFGDANIFFFSLPLFLFLGAYYLYLKKSMSVSIFLGFSVFVFVVSSAFMHKAALAMYFLSALFVYIYSFGFRLGRIFIFLLFLLLFLLLGFLVYYQGSTVSHIVDLVVYRIVGSYSFNTLFATEIFPVHQDFLWGWSMINPLGLGGGGGNLPGLIMMHVYGIDDGNASLSTYGHWYANFGWIGVGLCAIIVTVWLCALTFLHKFLSQHFFTLVIWLYFTISVLDFSRMELFTAIGIRDLFVAVIAVFLFYFFSTIRVYRR